MIAERLQQYVSWFGSATNVAWFVGFWLFVVFLLPPRSGRADPALDY
jgi:hypothetical protein